MNLEFFDGVKLRFGMGLDSGPLLDHVPLVGEQRVGPRRLLAELERSLGLRSVEFGAMDHTSMTRELLSRSHLGRDPFWRQLFQVDPIAVADDLLHVRDELTLAG